VDGLKALSRPESSKREKAQVAAVSAHNDRAMGELVAEATERVGNEGVVSVEEAKTTDTTLDVVEGMQFDRGYISPYFVTDPARMECAMVKGLDLAQRERVTSSTRFLTIVLAFALVGSAAAGARRLSGHQQDPTCVEFWPEIRHRHYGYDHIVHLYSRCQIRAFCQVSSDVNPKAVEIVVPPREQVEVLTFRGSSARQFTPRVQCRFRL